MGEGLRAGGQWVKDYGQVDGGSVGERVKDYGQVDGGSLGEGLRAGGWWISG